MEALLDEIRALALLSAANAVPVVVAKLIGDRWAAPLDFGWTLPDGERLFGSHKTWRGLASGVAACTLVGLLFDLRPIVGAGFACTSLLADAASSAAKRRMHLKPGTEYIGLDQIGEALLPLALFARPLSLGLGGEVIAVMATFIVLDLAVAQLRHRRWLR
jgi:CDP-2,3-bis-(O-geranylgeranyl)-sn-glycerol synthase